MESSKVIVSLFLKNEDSFFADLASIDESQACRIEIRLDSYYPAHSLLETNQMLKKCIKTARLPLLFTMRTDGQEQICTLQQYAWLMNILAKDGYDFDLEYTRYKKMKEQDLLPDYNASYMFLSFHNFGKYDAHDLEEILFEMKTIPAACWKIAQSCTDIDEVFSFIAQVQKSWQRRVSAVIAMGESGLITRLAPQLFGFDYTYCAWKESAAPGQLTLEQMEKYQSLLK